MRILRFIIPVFLIILQTLGYVCLFYVDKYGDARVPFAFMILNVLAILNALILILSYFLFFRAKNKTKLWHIPIFIAIGTILILLVQYIRMLIGDL